MARTSMSVGSLSQQLHAPNIPRPSSTVPPMNISPTNARGGARAHRATPCAAAAPRSSPAQQPGVEANKLGLSIDTSNGWYPMTCNRMGSNRPCCKPVMHGANCGMTSAALAVVAPAAAGHAASAPWHSLLLQPTRGTHACLPTNNTHTRAHVQTQHRQHKPAPAPAATLLHVQAAQHSGGAPSGCCVACR